MVGLIWYCVWATGSGDGDSLYMRRELVAAEAGEARSEGIDLRTLFTGDSSGYSDE